MTRSPNPESPRPRPPRTGRWRTVLAGGVLAGVGFVAAQAGSFDFLRLELTQFTKTAVHETPTVVRGPNLGPRRSYSSVPAPGSQDGMFVSASRNATGAADQGSVSADATATGDAMADADLFALSHGATPASIAPSQEPRQLDGRFHGALMSGGSGPAARPSYGAQPRRGPKDLADCCEVALAQPDSALLTQPVLANVLSGPVPESATWSMMILGFGMAGLVFRGQRRTLA